MRKILFCIYGITLCLHVFAQDSLKHNSRLYNMLIASHPVDSGSAGKSMVFTVPILGHTPEGGYEYGGAIFKNFYMPGNKEARPSYFTIKSSVTSKKAVNFVGYVEFWTKHDKNYLSIDIRHEESPLYYFGIGNNTHLRDEILLKERMSHINIETVTSILPGYYAGAGILLEKQSFSSYGEAEHVHGRLAPPEEKTGSYLNLSIIQTYDTRDNEQYSTNGIYACLKTSYLPRLRALNNFSGSLINFNFSSFTSPVTNVTFGYNLVYHQFGGKAIPFYLLPEFGSKDIMRGFYEGRFRDKKLFANQVELRYRFIPRLAVTGFAGIGETTHQKWDMTRFRSSFGCGSRYFFDVKEKSTVRVDYAFTQKFAGEKRQSGFYVLIGEAF